MSNQDSWDRLGPYDPEGVPVVPDQGEDEGDIDDPAAGFKAAIGSKDWTVETLVSQMRKGRIDLDPSFQRRNAWLDGRKSKLLESIMLGFPIPQIVLAEKKDMAGHYFVLDGKQRLLALRQFFVDDTDEKDKGFSPLKLSGLEVLSELNGNSVESLERDRPELLAAIENHSIRTVVLSDWNSENLLLSLFLRLNTGSVALSPQELRQALIHGEFITWLDRESGNLSELRTLLNNNHPDRRMVDAELFLRFLAFSASPFQYRGNLKGFLDDTSIYFNENWQQQARMANDALHEFGLALGAGLKYFGASTFSRKWSIDPKTGKGKFERALNRAIFDFQAYSLQFDEVRQAVDANRKEVLEQYKYACENDEQFVRAISSTTKTADAFIARHRVWMRILRDAADVEYPMPKPLVRD